MHPRVLSVGGRPTRSGGPLVHLALLAWMQKHDWDVTVAVTERGPLLDDFRAVAPDVCIVGARGPIGLVTGRMRIGKRGSQQLARRATNAYGRFALRGFSTPFDVVHVNGAPTLAAVPSNIGPVVVHVHELDYTFRELVNDVEKARFVSEPAHYISPSDSVTEFLTKRLGIGDRKVTQIREPLVRPIEVAPVEERDLVLVVGTLEPRKGADVFLQIVAYVQRHGRPGVRWVWLGDAPTPNERLNFLDDVRKAGLAELVTLEPAVADVDAWYRRATVVLSASREDPYPINVVEAAATGRPLVCFAGAGGAAELLAAGAGTPVPYLDVVAAGDAILYYLDHPEAAAETGRRGAAAVAETSSIDVVGSALDQVLRITAAESENARPRS